jgi:hypothetical protein
VVILAGLLAAPAAAGVDLQPDGIDADDVLLAVSAEASGDATWTIPHRVRLATDEAETVFESFRADLGSRFRNPMAGVAAHASNRSDRSMGRSGASLSTPSSDGVGAVTLTVRWTNLAAVDGDRLVVVEPFASGFEPDREFTVETPDGDLAVDATPQAAHVDGTEARWMSGTSLAGFRMVAAPADSTAGAASDGTSSDGAGFGTAVTVSVLLGAAVLARRSAG